MNKTSMPGLLIIGWILALAQCAELGQAASSPPARDSSRETRIVVIANTSAEADGLMAVLNSGDVRPKSLGAPHPAEQYIHQSSEPPPQGLRGFYSTNGATVDLWCVWELPGGNQAIDGRLNKVRQLPNVIEPSDKPAPAIVIAFGTAAGDWETSYNGSVVVGSAVLLHSLHSLENKEVTEALEKRGVALDQIVESPRAGSFLVARYSVNSFRRSDRKLRPNSSSRLLTQLPIQLCFCRPIDLAWLRSMSAAPVIMPERTKRLWMSLMPQ